MNKIISTLFLAFVFTLLGTKTLFACSCGAPPPIYEYFENSDAVFSGKVVGSEDVEVKEIEEEEDGTKIEDIYTKRVYEFEIIENFKGVKEKKVKLGVGRLDSSCFRKLAIGESYLIYADGKDGKNLSGGIACSRSGLLHYANDQIFFIRELLKRKPESQIYGSVVRYDNFPNTTKTRRTNLDSIKIVLEGTEKKFETVTDKNGYFKFNKIPDGEYLLKPQPSEIYKVIGFVRIKISDGKIYEDYLSGGFMYGYKSLFADFSLGWNNEIRGVVTDVEGKPVKLAAVRLLPANSRFEKIKSDSFGDNSKDGSYWLRNETPGKHYPVVEIFMPSANNEKVRIFYPQTESPDKTIPINLKATDKLNLDFILPAKYLIREVKGKITWSDGTPADTVKISLQKAEVYTEKDDDEDKEITECGFDWTFTDEQGNFVLQAFENEEYWLHYKDEVDIEIDGEEKEIEVKGKPVKIKVGKVVEPLELKLVRPQIY